MLNAQKNTERDLREMLYKRVRIYNRFIYRNESMSVSLGRHVAALEGVHFSKANPLTGKILVLFDESIVDESEIAYQIYTYVKHQHTKKRS